MQQLARCYPGSELPCTCKAMPPTRLLPLLSVSLLPPTAGDDVPRCLAGRQHRSDMGGERLHCCRGD